MSDKEVELIFFACQRRGRPCKQAGDIELIREVPVSLNDRLVSSVGLYMSLRVVRFSLHIQ